MNQLNDLKQQIDSLELNPEAKEALNDILVSAMTRGKLTLEERGRLKEILDIESESANLEADAYDEAADTLENLAFDITNAQNKLENDIQQAGHDMEDEIKQIVTEQPQEVTDNRNQQNPDNS